MSTTTVGHLMSKGVVALYPDEDLLRAKALMAKERSRHLPVVEGKRVVGLLTHRDLLRCYADALLEATDGDGAARAKAVRAGDVMRTAVVTIGPDAPAADAARLMLEHRLGCLPVVEDDELVGILTEHDLLRWTAERLANDWRD
jgi:CBS domain-containing protein